MNRPSFIIDNGDLILLFLYGAALCYFDKYVLTIPSLYVVLSALLVSFILGSFGPTVGEIVEWILFFCLGVFAVYLYPYLKLYHLNHEEIPLAQLLFISKNALTYSTQHLSLWLLGIPAGYLFYRTTRVPYYRNNF